MNTKLKKSSVLLAVVWMMISCSSPKKAATENNTKNTVVTEIVHDTLFKIERDSSAYKALLECQNGKIAIKEILQSRSGRNLENPKVRVINNKISVDCELKKQELYAFWKSKQTKEMEYKTITDTKYINRLTFWQKLQIWLGRIFLAVLAFYFIRRPYLP